jgi:hypothetical protein
VPTLEPLRDAVRLGYHYQRGEYERVVELGERFMAQHAPQTVIGWGPAYAVIAICMAETGRTRHALEICSAALATLTAADHEYFVMYLLIVGAQATAYYFHEEFDRSADIFRTAASRLAMAGENGALAVLHDHRARIARRMGRRDDLHAALVEMRYAALAADSAALVAQADPWAHVYAAMLLSPLPLPLRTAPQPLAPAAGGNDASDGATMETAVTAFLGRSQGESRPRRALELLTHAGRSAAGHLFVCDSSGMTLAASVGDEEPPPELEARLRELVASDASPGQYRVEVRADAEHEIAARAATAASYQVFLFAPRPNGPAVALAEGDDPLREVPSALLAEVGGFLVS